MTAYSDGHVFVSRPVETTLPCPMRLKKFPFDTQTCDLTFGSWGSSGEVIDTQARLDGDGEPVPLALHDLGGEVLGRAAERPRPVAAHPLGEPEVGDLEVALAVKQQVLRLQIHP